LRDSLFYFANAPVAAQIVPDRGLTLVDCTTACEVPFARFDKKFTSHCTDAAARVPAPFKSDRRQRRQRRNESQCNMLARRAFDDFCTASIAYFCTSFAL